MNRNSSMKSDKKKIKRIAFLCMLILLTIGAAITIAYAAKDTRELDLRGVNTIRDTTFTKVKRDGKDVPENYIEIEEFLADEDVQKNVPKKENASTGTYMDKNGKIFLYKVSCDKDGNGIARYCTIAMELIRLSDPTKYEKTNVGQKAESLNEYYSGPYHGRETMIIFGEEYTPDNKYASPNCIPEVFSDSQIKENAEEIYKQVNYVDYKVKDPEDSAYSIDYKIFCIDNIEQLMEETGHGPSQDVEGTPMDTSWLTELRKAKENGETYAIGFDPVITYTSADSSGRFTYQGAIKEYDYFDESIPFMIPDEEDPKCCRWINIAEDKKYIMPDYSQNAHNTVKSEYNEIDVIDFGILPHTLVAYIDVTPNSTQSLAMLSSSFFKDKLLHIEYYENSKDVYGIKANTFMENYYVLDNEDYAPVFLKGIKKGYLKEDKIEEVIEEKNMDGYVNKFKKLISETIKIDKIYWDEEDYEDYYEGNNEDEYDEDYEDEYEDESILKTSSLMARYYQDEIENKQEYNILLIPIRQCFQNLEVRFFDAGSDKRETVIKDTHAVTLQNNDIESKKNIDRLSMLYEVYQDYVIEKETGQKYYICKTEKEWGKYAPLFVYDNSETTAEGKDIHSIGYATAKANFTSAQLEMKEISNDDYEGIRYTSTTSEVMTGKATLYIPVRKETGEMQVNYVDEEGKTVFTEEGNIKEDGSTRYVAPNEILGGSYRVVSIFNATDSTKNMEVYMSHKPYIACSTDKTILNKEYDEEKPPHEVFEPKESMGAFCTVYEAEGLYGTTVLYIPVMTIATEEKIEEEKDDDIIVIVKNPITSQNTTTKQSQNSYSAPDLRTYNESDEFDLGKAIPTTETFTNNISCDTWYGSLKLKRTEINKGIVVHVSVSKQYAYYTYPYTKEVDASYYIGGYEKDKDGKSVWNPKKTYVPASKTVTDYDRPERNVGTATSDKWSKTYDYKETNGINKYIYYSIAGIDMRQLNKVSIDNNCFNSVKEYTSETIIPYKLITNPFEGLYKNRSEINTGGTVGSFSDNEWTHIQYPFSYEEVKAKKTYTSKLLPGVIDYGPKSTKNAGEEAKNTANGYRETQYKEYIKGKVLVMHSDTVELNNKVYCEEMSGHTGETNIGIESNDKFKDQKLVNIPQMTENHLYSTRLTAIYDKIMYGSGTTTIIHNDRGSDNKDETGDETKMAILPIYKSNEPIAVHSPVISPFRISDGEVITQSTRQNGTVTQLILDNNYTMTFDWDNLFERYNDYTKGYSVPAGWTKYVSKKEARFPFPIIFNGTYYPLKVTEKSKSGTHDVKYTEWIELNTDEWKSFEIYIPTWVETGIYDGSYSATVRKDWKESSIETRVWANNATEARNIKGYELNTTRDMYIAVYEYPVQISGIAYDFEVLTVNDQTSFGDDIYDLDNVAKLANMRQERKVGIYNRFGDKYIRYTQGEDVTDSWSSKLTLPFTTGKSNYLMMGTFSRGEKFSFMFRTISGSIDGNNDYVKIKPTFRYLDKNGKLYEQDELRIYYDYADKMFIEYGSDRDTTETSLLEDSFASKYYDGGVYKNPFGNPLDIDRFYNPFERTANIRYESIEDIISKKTKYGSLGELLLTPDTMLYTGDESQLTVNKEKGKNEALRYGSTLGTIGRADNQFIQSMQTWYGEYKIPVNMYVAKRIQDDGTAFSLYTDGEVRGWFEDHSEMDGTTKKSLFLQDGYLILGFDITVYVDGIASLSYHQSSLDMWNRENGGLLSYGAYSGPYKALNDGNIAPLNDPVLIGARSGDIAVIPLSDTLGIEGGDERVAGMLWIGK